MYIGIYTVKTVRIYLTISHVFLLLEAATWV